MLPLLLGVLVALLPAVAAAQDCGPASFIDAYKEGDAAAARGDAAAATARLRPLAEQGLGPAQLRLGQVLSGAAGSDVAEAHRWIALAADVGTPGAKDALAKLEPRVGAAQREQAKPAGWKPTLGACLSADPRTKLPDGRAGYDVKVLVNQVFAVGQAAQPDPARAEWFRRSLESVRTASPRHLIYLKMLAGVGFAKTGPLVVVDTRDNLPVVVVNDALATTSPIDGKTLTGAATYAVHKLLVPVTVAAETQSHRGRTIRFPASEEGRKFLAVMKQAIDMAETLPPDLAKQARAVLDIRYEPREPYDKRGGAIAPGDIARDPATKQVYLAYAENFDLRGASRIVINLTSAGIRSRRALEYQEAARQLEEARKRNATAEAAKAEQRMTEIKNMETGADKRGFCELLDVAIKTMEALKLDAAEINREYKVRFSRGCA